MVVAVICPHKSKFIIIAALILFLPTPVSGKAGKDYVLYLKSGNTNPSWDTLVSSGFDAFETGNLHTAFIFLQRAVDKGCHDGLVLFKLGVYHESVKNHKEAVSSYIKAAKHLVRNYPNHPYTKQLNESIGRSFYMMNEYGKALPYLEKAVKDNPNKLPLLLTTALVLKAHKAYGDAIKYLKRALRAPKNTNTTPNTKLLILMELATCYYETGAYKEALKYCEKVLQLDPHNTAAMLLKQEIQREQQRKKRRDILERVLK